MRRINWLLATAMATALLVTIPSGGGMAHAAVTVHEYHIAGGQLAVALNELAEQSHAQIFYAADLVKDKTSKGLSGDYSIDEALRRLLRGTGLHGEPVNDNTWMVRADDDPAQTPSATSTAAPEGDSSQPMKLASVVVSASRIDSANIVAVTPTVSFTPQSLQLPTYSNVGDALYDLPYFTASRGPSSTGTNTNAGSSPVDLRGLGAKRTLLLVDGRRIAGINDAGSNDLNAIPSILIKRVDVVTGGASAAWGSDAVSGVVNVTMDHDFTGFKVDASYGQSKHADDKTRTFRAAAGTDFASGKGHVEIGGDFVKAGGIVRHDRPRTSRWMLLPVNGTNRLAYTPNVGQAEQALGGVITSGVLKGKAFAPDGSLYNHKLQRVVGTLGIGDNAPSSDDYSYVMVPRKHYTALASMHYDFSDSLRLSTTVRYFESSSDYTWFSVGFDGITIQDDNAFLSDQVRQTMQSAGETSFQLGRFRRDINYPRLVVDNKALQETVKLDGTTSNAWRWTAYYSHGLSDMHQSSPGFFINENLAQSVDSVIDPATRQPVCRVALTNPASACVPINLFGEGAPSEEAQSYVTGTPREHVTRTLDQGGFSIRGEPWELPAGYVSTALGIEARHVSINQRVGELDAAKAFRTFFYNPEQGAYSVTEVFGEVNIPLLNDKPGFRDTAIDLAVRNSDYSTSGQVWTWKAGLTNEFFDGFRARIGYSRDIRAPSLNEMYQEGTQGFNNVFDPVVGQTYLVLDNAGGNRQLQPEKANTLTAGLSWAPSGNLSGLVLSADYFDIDVKDIITTVGTQDTINRCQSGNVAMCSRIHRGDDGRIAEVSSQFINLSEFRENGVDLEANYTWRGSLFGIPGEYRSRTIATWVHKLTTDDGVTRLNYVGSVGNSFAGKGMPRWRTVSNFGFRNDSFSLNARVRYFSAGYHDVNQDIINNRVPQYFYFDVGGSYALSGQDLVLYLNIRNLADKKPPIASGFSPFYDVIGRYASAGIRLHF